MSRDLTFAGFGFGPIQAGLFALEAQRSGNFGRIVIAEVLPELVQGVRAARGVFTVNVARRDGVETVKVGPVEMADVSSPEDRERLIAALREADEVATAVPSVRFYRGEGPESIHRLLARGLERRGDRPVVIYAAENHNHAAELLAEAVLTEVAPERRGPVRRIAAFANTVIGKMSGTIADPGEIRSRGLEPVTPGSRSAFLVEAFNRILVSKPRFPAGVEHRRGFEVFEEKEDLLPFEEAKLYGHNATHALAAYLAAHRGLARLDELRALPGGVEFLRAAFLEESGRGLIHKHRGVDRLFSEEGFREYAGDLIERMLNPHLGDLVGRVARDPERKLGWSDRLVGTMRLARAAGVEPRRFALGAALALVAVSPELLAEPPRAGVVLARLWREEAPEPVEAAAVSRAIEQALREVARGLPL